MSLLAMCQPNILYGGPGGSRTRVQDAFTLKGLQQFLKRAECCLPAVLFDPALLQILHFVLLVGF